MPRPRLTRFGLWEFPDGLSWSGKCKSCHASLDRNGTVCRSCSRKFWAKSIIGSVVVVELCVGAAYLLMRPSVRPQDIAQVTATYHTPQQTSFSGPSGWVYYETKDTLIGDVTHHARLISNRPTIGLDHKPLPGSEPGTLELSDSERYGKTVLLTLPPTQAACETNVCTVHAIFDDGPEQNFPFQDISDDRHRVLAIGDYDRFTGQLQRSHDLRVMASLGTPQDVTVNFTVSGYHTALAKLRHWAALMVAKFG